MLSTVLIKPSPPANNLVDSVVMTREVKRATALASIRVVRVRPALQIMDRCARRPRISCRLCRSNWKEKDSRSANSQSTSRGSRQVQGRMLCERVGKDSSMPCQVIKTGRSGARACMHWCFSRSHCNDYFVR